METGEDERAGASTYEVLGTWEVVCLLSCRESSVLQVRSHGRETIVRPINARSRAAEYYLKVISIMVVNEVRVTFNGNFPDSYRTTKKAFRATGTSHFRALFQFTVELHSKS